MHQTTSRRVRGVTLVELMVFVAIVAILAVFALPAFADLVRRGQSPEAFNALLDYELRMERYYLDHRNYGADGKCAPETTANSWNAFTSSSDKYFGYSCRTLDGGQGYVIDAQGRPATASEGYAYAVNSKGEHLTTRLNGNDVLARCWLTRGLSC